LETATTNINVLASRIIEERLQEIGDDIELEREEFMKILSSRSSFGLMLENPHSFSVEC
jgi:hypothetical protein